MTHYIEKGGRFDKACATYLAAGDAFLYHDRDGDEGATKTRKKKAASKTKFTCPDCEQNAWAKPDAHLVCGDCGEAMEAEEGEGLLPLLHLLDLDPGEDRLIVGHAVARPEIPVGQANPRHPAQRDVIAGAAGCRARAP